MAETQRRWPCDDEAEAGVMLLQARGHQRPGQARRTLRKKLQKERERVTPRSQASGFQSCVCVCVGNTFVLF